MQRSARRAARQALAARGVNLAEEAAVQEALPGKLVLEDGRVVPADEIIWCTDAAAPAWLAGASPQQQAC